jgi:hypothetical protein
MSNQDELRLPDELDALALRLRAERPRLSPLELDRAKRRMLAGAPHTSIRTKGSIMRSRLALIAILAFGALFSGTGAVLALDTSLSASQVTYQPTNNQPTVLGQNQSGQTPTTPTTTPQTLPSTTSGTPAAKPAQQAAATTTSGETLPFTGLAAIPILLIGLGMLVLGAVIARRTRRGTA